MLEKQKYWFRSESPQNTIEKYGFAYEPAVLFDADDYTTLKWGEIDTLESLLPKYSVVAPVSVISLPKDQGLIDCLFGNKSYAARFLKENWEILIGKEQGPFVGYHPSLWTAVSIETELSGELTPSHRQALEKNGWFALEKDRYQKTVPGEFELTYRIKSTSGISVLSIHKLTTKIKYKEMPEFEIEEAWKKMWSKNVVPMEVKIVFKRDYTEDLKSKGWNASEPGFDHMLEFSNSDCLIAKFGEEHWEFTDSCPGKTDAYLERLRSLGWFI